MQLQEFFDYKNQIMEDMLTSERIVKLINENTPMDEAGSLMYTQVFPYEYLPDTIEDSRTLVCVDVDIQGTDYGKIFLQPVLYVWTLVHRSKMRLPEGGVRSDALCSEICKKINGSMMYGMGQLDLYSVKRFAPMTDYNGKMMVFHAREWSKQYNPDKYIPANRKMG